MNPQKRMQVAFTLIELLVEVAVIAILMAMFGNPYRGGKEKARLVQCLSNLKRVGSGLNLWTGTKENLFPWEVSTNAGGTLELIPNGNATDHFLPLATFVPQAIALFVQLIVRFDSEPIGTLVSAPPT